MGLDHRINLGSANKMFTAVAIMQLVEQGKVDLNTAIGSYLPDLPNPQMRDRVTLHHLLTHTSGVGDFMNPDYSAKKKEIRVAKVPLSAPRMTIVGLHTPEKSKKTQIVSGSPAESACM